MKISPLITLFLFIVIVGLSSYLHDDPADSAALGEILFKDVILSKDRTVSCASCHKPEFAFADSSAFSLGVNGVKGQRNTPSTMNVRLQKTFFWDGRSKTLEDQALAPIENPSEMNLPIGEAVKRLVESERYNRYFNKIFQAQPNQANLAKALASFERTLETSDSPFDNWKFTDDSTAVSASAKRGFKVFNGKGKCNRCHFGADFTANEFRNIGLFNGLGHFKDSGRSIVTGDVTDIGKFKTPSLRNVSVTAPYMHNGIYKTIEEVIEFYNNTEKSVPSPINKDTILAKPLNLTSNEKKDLEEFLLSLTDQKFLKKRSN